MFFSYQSINMVSMASSSKMFRVAILTVLAIFRLVVVEGLSPHHYSSSCPELLPTVRAVVVAAVMKEARMGASLLRLHFHDCFVHGCDGSILLDGNSTHPGEKEAIPNFRSVRGYEVVDDIKEAVEKVCPGVVSCADILAIAARDSTVFLGGKSWKVRLGRRDSTTAYKTTAEDVLPSADSDLCELIIDNFANQGLSIKDLVTLSGAHTIGLASCKAIRHRIYNDTNINLTFAKKLQERCPEVGRHSTLFPMDQGTPKHFDNFYYRNLMNQKGLLHSDQVLIDRAYTLSIVKKYVKKPSSFLKNFAKSMVRMGNIRPLTGSKGEIRINCRKVN